MSYTLYLYSRAVKDAIQDGSEIEEVEHPRISPEVIEDLKLRLPLYNYEVQSETPVCTEYVHRDKKWAIQIAVFSTEIAFSIPYWEDADNAIKRALEDADEFADAVGLVVYDPQMGDWNE